MVESATVVSGPSSPSRKLRSLIISIFAGLAILIAITAAAAPWAFSNAALRNEIAAQIRHVTGLAAISHGRAVFVVLPQPHISIDGVSFADPSGALRIDARYFKGYVRLAPLFAGRIEIASATLGQPELHIDLDGRPMPTDSVIGRAADASPATAEAASADAARLGAVTLVDGRARLTSKQFSPDLSIDAINMTLDWAKPGAAAIVTGQARIRGENAAIAAWIASPAGLLRGQQSALSLKIGAPSFSLSADGGLANMPKWQFNGHIHAAAPSVRTLLEQAEYSVPFPGPLNDFDANCEATIAAASAALSGLHLRFDGNDFEGTLAFQARDDAPVLSGTLATNRLSLRPFLSNLSPATGRDGQWNRDPFDLKEYGSADLDFRISASHMLFSYFEIEDAAFSLMRNSSRVELTLAGAKAYQGTIKGRVTFDVRDNGVGMRATGAISGADLAALSFDAFGWPEFYGALTGMANLESAGASMSELMRNLDGTAQIDVAQGQLGGIDLDSVMHRIDKSPLALLADIHRGRTAFERAGFGLRFVKGVAGIEEGKLENPSLRLGFGGTVDFGERRLDLHAVAMPSIGDAKPGKEIPRFRFDVGGSWDDLAFTPDVRGLIRRSGAAAPLFSQQPDVAKHLGSGREDAK
ncbi:MAG: AsmA family protein [Pseudomonadota bacterium]|nr:AsmA family protein [Pseudomonadota bacterium]